MCARRKASDKKKTLFSDEFFSDMSVPDMLHAVLIRSPFAGGVISSIGFAPKAKIPEGTIFVMGDNRNNSEDSRFYDVGFVPFNLIKGKAILIFWPLDDFKSL